MEEIEFVPAARGESLAGEERKKGEYFFKRFPILSILFIAKKSKSFETFNK